MKTNLGGLWAVVIYQNKEEAGINNETLFENDYGIYGISDCVKRNTIYSLHLTLSKTSSTAISYKKQKLVDNYYGKIHSLRKNQPKYHVVHHPDEDLSEDAAYRVILMKNRLNLRASSICRILGLLRSYVAFILGKYRK